MNFATTNKIKGIIILAITFIALIIATGFFGIRYADMKDELKDRESCTEHIETIERLQNELSELQNQQKGAETNNETNIKEKALFYLNTFYSADQEKNIKPLMTEEAYKKLYSTDTYRWTQITSDYKVTINNPIIYYTKISDTECDVLIFADFDEAVEFFTSKEYEKFKVKASHPLFAKPLMIENELFVPNESFDYDYKDVKGQENAKFACLIAALGMHNILFEGSAGSGKSMCAKRLVYIMPPQSLNEVLQASAYQSLNSKDSEFSSIRAFRNPHHTSTRASIFGGGTKGAKIGEVALANGGVLFFDEFPHFGKNIIESLREPLEDNQILVSRVNSKVNYETKFLFAAAQNPCPCGNLFSPTLSCRCNELEIKRYKNCISSAILDRIDLYVAMEKVSKDDKSTISSKELSKKVLDGFIFQKKRGQKEFNAKLKDEDLKEICVADKDAQSTLELAISRYSLSQRAINKTLKVARTCADLEQRECINKSHILQALSFRVKER